MNILKFNFSFDDLNNTEKLKELDDHFIGFIGNQLGEELKQARTKFDKWTTEHSKLALMIAPYLEDFIAEFFDIKLEILDSKSAYGPLAKIYECKRIFVQRIALKSNKDSAVNAIEQLALLISDKLAEYDTNAFEQIFAEYVLKWLSENDQDKLDMAAQYAIWACLSPEGQLKHKNGILFKFPHKLNFDALVPLVPYEDKGIKTLKINEDECHERKGFKLTDPGCKLDFAFDQSNYCIHCHNQGKDSCSKGRDEEKKGCPLDEKISEMNYLKTQGNIIGALAMAIVDNPMLAATGHRICNDCMKACIFQKQQPVDIPQIETQNLKDVLKLSWGFEIYALLTKWNPLSFARPYPKSDSGAKILVAGMGPAGFTLAHHLLNEGHIVVGIDGLKIEPLAADLMKPIKNIEKLFKDLDERIVAGFGGVMEYGITNRWDKNFLLVIRLLLERRSNFKLFGGVRLGSNITIKQAFDLGFQHIALALGAGSPRLLSLENQMARGMRTASDFLMSLQLGKAYQKESLTNLQIRMPVVVIGGGLTALDAATEALAYYPLFLDKFAANYHGNTTCPEDEEVAKEFLKHHELLKSCTNQLSALKELGGVKILYRNKLQKAPSYRLNHEELNLGLSEGVEFVENFAPKKIILDQYNHVSAIKGTQIIDGIENEITIEAKTILIAAGTVPNVILAQEFPEFLSKDDGYFRQKQDKFITYNDGINSISFLGDLHPEYAGNVVKAMASAKHSYPVISKLLKEDKKNSTEFFNQLQNSLVATLVAVNRLTSNIVELVINAPFAAANFKPGQFFRLQNYANSKLPLMEGIALTGAKVENGNISTIVLEMGGSSNLCSKLELGKPVVLMGPTGEATEITPNQNIMLVGGGLGNAVLFSIGQAFRKNDSKVLYFAGYRKKTDRYKIEEIEAAADQIIWSCDEDLLEITRKDDLSYKGNIVQSIIDFAQKNPNILKSIDRIIVIGSDKMMAAVKAARLIVLKPYLNDKHVAIASINSPMQCMMKEICGQCIQKHIDPDTGQETYVFSCTNQDQEMDKVDFIHLGERLAQNRILEINSGKV